MINSFFFNDYSKIIHEYFQAKIGRKMRIFRLARKNNILIYTDKRVYLGNTATTQAGVTGVKRPGGWVLDQSVWV